MVWRCYKYLMMRQHAMRSLLPYVSEESAFPRGAHTPVIPTTLIPVAAPLPNYEEAVKQSPPPSYQVATAYLNTEQTLPGAVSIVPPAVTLVSPPAPQ
jgi:hypothetical protein